MAGVAVVGEAGVWVQRPPAQSLEAPSRAALIMADTRTVTADTRMVMADIRMAIMADTRITAALTLELMLMIAVHPITATADILRCILAIRTDATMAGDARVG